jgi:hypothetical protein
VRQAGCSGAAGAVCCGDTEWSLERKETSYDVYKTWHARPVGSYLRDGKAPQNWRADAAEVTVRAGTYTAVAAWPNVFLNKDARVAGGSAGVRAALELSLDRADATFVDAPKELQGAYLLRPAGAAAAAGFVVPAAAFPEAPAPLDAAGWAACRRANCGRPAGGCVFQEATPYAARRGVTTAKVLADAHALTASGKAVPRTCWVIGPETLRLQTADLSPGAAFAAQAVGCDYEATGLAAAVHVPRRDLESGFPPSPPPARSPPPPPPQAAPVAAPAPPPAGAPPSPSPAPAPALAPVPEAAPTLSTSSPDPPAPPAPAGPAVWFVARLPAYSVATFDAAAEAAFVKRVARAALGASPPPVVRVRSVTSAVAGGEGGAGEGGAARRRLAQAGGVDVDAIAAFAPADATPAAVLAAALRSAPATVFPPATYGAGAAALRVEELNCVSPCGANGFPGPRLGADGAAGCTCECAAGWATAHAQGFEDFVYCGVAAGSPEAVAGGAAGGAGDGAGDWLADGATNSSAGEGAAPGAPLPPPLPAFLALGILHRGPPSSPPVAAPLTAPHLLRWRPPVAVYPPPPPKEYVDNGGGTNWKLWVGVAAGVLAAAVLAVVAWKTACCGCSLAACLCCCRRRRTAADESSAAGGRRRERRAHRRRQASASEEGSSGESAATDEDEPRRRARHHRAPAKTRRGAEALGSRSDEEEA